MTAVEDLTLEQARIDKIRTQIALHLDRTITTSALAHDWSTGMYAHDIVPLLEHLQQIGAIEPVDDGFRAVLPFAALVPLDRLQRDGDTQARIETNADHVARLVAAIERGEDLPPVELKRDDKDRFWIGDGFHRVDAHVELDRDSIRAVITRGDERDAFIHNVRRNARNGLNFSNADKRFYVERLLRDPEWVTWSDHKIADDAGVSHTFVGNVRKELAASGNGFQIDPDQRQFERGGKVHTMDTAGINDGRPPSRPAGRTLEADRDPEADDRQGDPDQPDPSSGTSRLVMELKRGQQLMQANRDAVLAIFEDRGPTVQFGILTREAERKKIPLRTLTRTLDALVEDGTVAKNEDLYTRAARQPADSDEVTDEQRAAVLNLYTDKDATLHYNILNNRARNARIPLDVLIKTLRALTREGRLTLDGRMYARVAAPAADDGLSNQVGEDTPDADTMPDRDAQILAALRYGKANVAALRMRINLKIENPDEYVSDGELHVTLAAMVEDGALDPPVDGMYALPRDPAGSAELDTPGSDPAIAELNATFDPDAVSIANGSIDTGAWHRCVEIARKLVAAGLWDGHARLTIYQAYDVHDALFGINPVDPANLRRADHDVVPGWVGYVIEARDDASNDSDADVVREETGGGLRDTVQIARDKIATGVNVKRRWLTFAELMKYSDVRDITIGEQAVAAMLDAGTLASQHDPARNCTVYQAPEYDALRADTEAGLAASRFARAITDVCDAASIASSLDTAALVNWSEASRATIRAAVEEAQACMTGLEAHLLIIAAELDRIDADNAQPAA